MQALHSKIQNLDILSQIMSKFTDQHLCVCAWSRNKVCDPYYTLFCYYVSLLAL